MKRLLKTTAQTAPAQPEEKAGDRDRQAAAMWKGWQEWCFIRLRRLAHMLHEALACRRAVGPVSFLSACAALGVALTLTTLYTPSYAVLVDGEQVGVVADQDLVDLAIREVEAEGTSLLGYDYQVEGDVGYQFALSLRSDLTDQEDLEAYFFQQLDAVSDHLRQCEVLVDGRSMGVVKDEDTLNEMLDGMKAQYVNENTTSAGFVQNLSVNYVYAADALMTVGEMQEALEANTTGDTTYTVQKGDTFNAIAYANDMSVSDLKALNPGVDINRLMVGDVLNVKELIPVLSVETTEHVTYSQAIECPVEEVEDSSMYIGDTKVLTQGEEGEARVEADVVYVNGVEQERTIISSTTVREPTTTVMAVGTKEKPKTASKGYFIWPTSSHRINSYFGGRNLWGSYDYHSGLDIHASYGEQIKAADGGTVTFAGWRGSYGNLVIITHDNGIQTYYAHNSSFLVSAGEKVYQGQPIARAGSTGNSSGPHCHFEVRVGGSAVNPLNYLS